MKKQQQHQSNHTDNREELEASRAVLILKKTLKSCLEEQIQAFGSTLEDVSKLVEDEFFQKNFPLQQEESFPIDVMQNTLFEIQKVINNHSSILRLVI